MSTKAGNTRAHPRAGARGYTLVEVLIAVSLACLIITAILSALVYVARTEFSISNYVQMDQQARRALEYIGRDIKQCNPQDSTNPLAVAITNAGAANETQTITVAIPSTSDSSVNIKVLYKYLATDSARKNTGTLTRTQYNTDGSVASTRILIDYIAQGSFVISGSELPNPTTNVATTYSGAANVAANIANIKQIQVQLRTQSDQLYTRLTGGSSQQIITAQYSIRRNK